MSLDIQIRVDTSGALPAANRVEAALGKVEAAGARAGARTSKGMKDAGDQMDRTGQKAGSLAAAMKQMAAGAGIAFGIKEVFALSDAHTGLKNRLRQVAGSQEDLNRLMERTKQIANSTRSDWKTTAESFVRLSQATKDLGLSQERGLKITETLNMALQSSGASSSEAAAGTLQLMQAMSAGALQGDEFRSIAENIPVLMDVLSKQLGVTRGELKKMGADGKITTDVLIKGLESFATTAKKTFEESEETFGQFATRMKNEAVDYLGGGVSLTSMTKNWASATQQLRLEEVELLNVMGRQGELMGNLIGDATGMTAATYALTKSQLEHMRQTNALVFSLTKLAEMMQVIKNIQPNMQAGHWIGSLKVQMTAAAALVADAREKWEAKLNARGSGGGDTAFAEEVQGFSSSQALENQVRSQTTFASIAGAGDSFSSATLEAIAFERELEGIALAAKKYELDMASANDGVARGFNKIADEIQNTAQLTENLLVNAFHGFEDAMVQAALTGEFSFGKMVDQLMADLARLAVRQLMAAALTAAIGGSGPLPGVSVPGFGDAFKGMFASGGSFMVGGNGGTDTTPVAFMATPGERVTVETPAQQSMSRESSGGGSGGQSTVIVQNNYDPRAILKALHSREGATVIANVLRDNPGLLKR